MANLTPLAGLAVNLVLEHCACCPPVSAASPSVHAWAPPTGTAPSESAVIASSTMGALTLQRSA